VFNSHDAVLKESTFNNVTLFQPQSGLNSIESLNAIKPYGIIMGVYTKTVGWLWRSWI